MFKNVAASFVVFAFDITTGAAKTGDAANITAYVSKDYGSVTVLADTSATEMDATNAKGYYLFAAAQGETNADCLMVSAKSSTSNISVVGAPAVIYTRPTTGWLAPATAGRTLVVDAAGLADANVVKLGPTGSGTAQTARDVGASVIAASVSTNGIAAASFAAGAVDAAALAADAGTEIATAVWAKALETGFTADRLMRITAAAVAGKVSGGPGSPVFRNVGDTLDQVTGTADASGNRSAATYGA